jgi:hypothetical protein
MYKQHPEQRIQEEWMKWQRKVSFTYERYKEFMEWVNEYRKNNPID